MGKATSLLALTTAPFRTHGDKESKDTKSWYIHACMVTIMAQSLIYLRLQISSIFRLQITDDHFFSIRMTNDYAFPLSIG